jgi:hypothetical protein
VTEGKHERASLAKPIGHTRIGTRPRLFEARGAAIRLGKLPDSIWGARQVGLLLTEAAFLQ